MITTEQNGAGELMTDGREGFILTSPRAEAELIAALDKMADDRGRRRDVGRSPAAGPSADVRRPRRAIAGRLRGGRAGKKGRVPHSGKWGARSVSGPHADRSKRSRQGSPGARKTTAGRDSGRIEHAGSTPGGRQGYASETLHVCPAQAADAAGRRGADARSSSWSSASSRGPASATSRSSPDISAS